MNKSTTKNIYEIIQILAKNIKEESEELNDFEKKSSCMYLLNQTIRQVKLDETHYTISKKAKELWNEIIEDGEGYKNFFYNEIITIKKDSEIDLYKGNEKKPYSRDKLKANSKISYNKIFHNEHTIPVSTIIDEILKTDLSIEKINEVIGKISICRMLKSEDRLLKTTRKRVFDLKTIYNNEYNEAGIEIYE
jgi:hypothetical protein